MAVQTSYSRYFKSRIPGQESDTARTYKREALNKTGADLAVGIAVAQDSSADTGVDLMSTIAQKIIGIILNDFGRNPNGMTIDSNGQTAGYKALAMAPMLVEGPVTVQIDQDCKPGDSVYVRYAASGNGQTGIVGAFRKDGDGVAAVVTVTPTAADTTAYRLLVMVSGKAFVFEVTSAGGATATTIVTLFKTAMAADLAFSAEVTASGTSTLILTATHQNEPLVVSTSGSAGTITAALTTPASGTARRTRSRWLSTGTATSGVGEIYFSAAEETR